MTCPSCLSIRIVGEQAGTVLFWRCLSCGDRWHRWPDGNDGARGYVEHGATESDVRAMLAVVYTPADLDIWFTAPHLQLHGRSARQAIAEGDGNRVLAIAEQLVTGAYI